MFARTSLRRALQASPHSTITTPSTSLSTLKFLTPTSSLITTQTQTRTYLTKTTTLLAPPPTKAGKGKGDIYDPDLVSPYSFDWRKMSLSSNEAEIAVKSNRTKKQTLLSSQTSSVDVSGLVAETGTPEEVEALLAEAYAAIPVRAGARRSRFLNRLKAKMWRKRKQDRIAKSQRIEAHFRKMEGRSRRATGVKDAKVAAKEALEKRGLPAYEGLSDKGLRESLKAKN